MTTRGIGFGGRVAALALATVLVLVLAGDGGRAATVPAVINGQDPLEVLSLKVRPNVIVVLDSSGSMTSRVPGGNTDSGDHPRSRMFQAKKVLYDVIRDNQDKASFMFGNYTQVGARLQNTTAGDDRFQYYTSSDLSPIMVSNELTIQRALDDGNDEGLRSWQLIYQEWNTLWFEEENGGTCQAVLPGPFPKFYARGGSATNPAVSTTPQNLAFDLQTAMNGATCTGGSRSNTYAVSYSAANGDFRFSATGPTRFRLRNRAAIATNNISEAFGGFNTTGWVDAAGGGPAPVTMDWNRLFLRRNRYRRVYTNGPHGLSVGDVCTITNVPDNGGFWEGTWTVTQIDASDEFRLSGSTSPSSFNVYRPPSNGTVTCIPSGGGSTGGVAQTDDAYMLLYREGSGTSGWVDFQWSENIDGNTVEFYQTRAGRLWNGETIYVESDGTICDVDFGDATTRTSPPSYTVQQVNSNCGSPVAGVSAVFEFAGGVYGGNSVSCSGFHQKVGIIPCDLKAPPAALQITNIAPYIDLQLPFNPDGTAQNYAESMDGSWVVTNRPLDIHGGAKANGSTPIANTLIDIKGAAGGQCLDFNDSDGDGNTTDTVACVQRNWERFWFLGPDIADPSTNPAWASVPAADRPIQNHLDPKEKTIVLFVTDGDDTCGLTGYSTDDSAKRAAFRAQQLYTPLAAGQEASSVITYVVGFGFSSNRLDWIAWGGSGLGQNQPGQPAVNDDNERWTDGATTLANLRAQCETCIDHFPAPTADVLAETLQAIIDQGASSGEFSAQQSITETIFEYVDLATNGTDTYDPRAPSTRYQAIVPTRIISSFTLPGFQGHLRAIQNDGTGIAVEKWDAGDKLRTLVANTVDGMGSCDTSARGGGVGECAFAQLHGNETEATIATSATAKIRRRVFTTERNGVFTYDAASLIAGTANQRVTLWPPATSLIPTNYANEALLPGGLSFDAALGLPAGAVADPAAEFAQLQNDFGACVGTNRPSECTSSSATTRMLAARREAREMILAFMAGAKAVPADPGVKRASSSGGGVSYGSIFYKARSWVLADSELATPAVVTQPLPSEPLATPWLYEYGLFRDGVRTSAGKNPDSSGSQIKQGYGLRNPDNDQTVGTGVNDTRSALKPVMTVVYAPANDMLHAFRAGPNVSPSTTCDDVVNATHECGGQELWGFVPFDQLEGLRLRLVNEPQGRDNHVYMLARGVRFSDVFVAVPAASNPPINVTAGGVSLSVNGVWRRILYIPRGIGGKYMTALDVTGPGAYTTDALQTLGPIPLWSRGNPDTLDGTSATANAGSTADRLAYSAMGETWSLPTVAFRDKSANPSTVYNTTRRPDGVDYVLYMGSGFGATGEGTTFYTLDALSGDVIEDVDVELAAAANGLTRTGLSYPNALVANAVGFNPAVFSLLQTVHPAASAPTRIYIGDTHGRLWKILTARPDVAIPVADLGEDQPIGTAVSLLGMPPSPDVPVPYIFLSSGNDKRAEGPFKNFGFRDDGTDTQVTIGGGVVLNDVTTFPPAVSLHTRTYDQGDPGGTCGYTEEAVFRGTIQPATAFECSNIANGQCSDPVGRVFFGGTRLNLPNTNFAPPTPLACGQGDYPCRSSFDSIVYALGAKTGLAAYDLNSSGDDAYRIFRDNRISAIAMLADPDPGRGGSSFNPDEGEMKGNPKPPPPPGVPPTGTTATANVIMRREPGQPPPSVHYGSTVCQ